MKKVYGKESLSWIWVSDYFEHFQDVNSDAYSGRTTTSITGGNIADVCAAFQKDSQITMFELSEDVNIISVHSH